MGPDHVVKLNFVEDALSNGRKLRTLTLVDAYTRECPHIEADTSLPSLRVIRVLNHLAEKRGLPATIRVDHGPEFISKALDAWALSRGVVSDFARPGKPTDKAHIESFNGRFRDEVPERDATVTRLYELRDYDNHEFYTDDKYVFDPRLSFSAIPKGDFEKLIKSLNPNGYVEFVREKE